MINKGVTFKGGRGVAAESGEPPKDKALTVPYKKGKNQEKHQNKV